MRGEGTQWEKGHSLQLVHNRLQLCTSMASCALFRKRQFVHKMSVPLNPSPRNQQSEGFPLQFPFKVPRTELRTLSQNCEQTLQKLRTNGIMNKRAFLTFCKGEILSLTDDTRRQLWTIEDTYPEPPCESSPLDFPHSSVKSIVSEMPHVS